MEVWVSPDLPPLKKRRDLSTVIMEVFVWGSHHYGQLGLGETEDASQLHPTLLKTFQHKEIRQIACGDRHSLALLLDGSVFSCGDNDQGQLGLSSASVKVLTQISALEAHVVTQVQCGESHSLAITKQGYMYAWGDNSLGQLGCGPTSENRNHLPRMVKTLSSEVVIQIASGSQHCMALTEVGKLYVWGSNSTGQLGLGGEPQRVDLPTQLSSLAGLSIRQIIASNHHSIALSVSGAVYSWGKNECGQLGIGQTGDRNFPTVIKTLRSQRVKYIATGESHSSALTETGGVFTFGGGKYGQLGHSTTQDETLPRQVMELMGSTVAQIACGRRHTLALVPLSGRVYACGLGANGQLGTGSSVKCLIPTRVAGPFIAAEKSIVNVKPGDNYVIKQIFAGGDQSFVTAKLPKTLIPPFDQREDTFLPAICQVTEDLITRLCDSSPPRDILMLAEKVFSAPECLNASFLLTKDHYNCSGKHIGVDLATAQQLLSSLSKLTPAARNTLTGAIEKKLLPALKPSPPDMEALRLFLTLPFHPSFKKPEEYQTIMVPFGRALLKLTATPAKVLEKWWEIIPVEQFEYLVTVYREIARHVVQQTTATSSQEAENRYKGLHICMEVLKKLNKVNMQNSMQKPIIAYEKFYIPEVREKVNIKEDYVSWIQRNRATGASDTVSFCDYPFIFDAQAKTMLLHTDAIIQMQFAVEDVTRRNMMGLFLPQIDPVNPCLVLFVNRDNLVTETINQLTKKGSADFKKPLKVMFVGEDAVDEGGVRKEFFMLLLREILDPKFGMFKYFEESRQLWFNESTFEDPEYFHLIGILCGLAIYNQTIINLNFPLALYKKLLKRKVLLEDLKELEPSVGKSLEHLLEYQGDDVEQVYDLTFEITRIDYGQTTTVELAQKGSDTRVSQSNKKEYVDLYIEYVFNKSVKVQFEAFYGGFHKVVGGKVLDLFHPQELMAMVVGNENYDWDELERTCDYKNGFDKDDPPVKLFWEVFKELEQKDKKKFLLFLTGSDRIPIHGMKAIKMYIQPMGDNDNMLPVAHTCFNLLDLPRYRDKEQLRYKLLTAITHTQGFGLV